MAQRRSSPHQLASASTNTPTARRKYPFRRSPPTRKHTAGVRSVSSASPTSNSRPVLVTLHPNLRRLPSRSRLAALQKEQDTGMRDLNHNNAQAGTKRKRVASTNENAYGGGRPTRGSGRLKRLRRASDDRMQYTSDEGETSSMDIDGDLLPRWGSVDNSDEDEEELVEDEDEEDETSDDYLLNSAQPQQLQRLRKDDLIRLYILAGLTEDAESLTKSEIVECIIAARDDLVSLPPSSPPHGDGGSSDYSSDDGNMAENELEDARINGRCGTRGNTSGLRRRATTNDLGRNSSRPTKGRSMSLGDMTGGHVASTSATHAFKGNSKRFPGDGQCASRARRPGRSPPSTSASASAPVVQSPLVTRLRSRKLSAPTDITHPPSATASTLARMNFNLPKAVKGKGKQVEFSDDVQVKSKTPSKRSVVAKQLSSPLEEESDLTELEESDTAVNAPPVVQPSPRRLRSRDKEKSVSEDEVETEVSRRITPKRKAKDKIKHILEETDDQEEANEDSQEEDEVDELVSTASASPPLTRARRTPVRRRLRPRQKPNEADADDGDDEEEEEEEEEDNEDENGGEEDENDDDDDDESTIAVEPRILRNGKIVGEDEDMDVEEDIGDDDEADAEEDENIDAEEVEDDLDVEGETDGEEEAMEDEVDLTVATAKSLIRLRRDDLVRLCETHDVEPIGTKPQLAEALLQWRDHRSTSSRSSTGTIRPPSTVKRRRGGRRSNDQTTPPVLLRNGRVHADEPRTPPVSQKKDEPELELDLETLGLEDREIPCDKLQKLEKIGSGGFKDVFIGKFKGRRIAISEFRGQLSAMDIKELKLLGGFDHPNIVRFLGVSIPENTKETPVMIVSELCSNGDLFDYVRNVPPPSLRKVLNIMLDIARGLEYLHLRKPSVIHRDCKSSNILITSRGTAKIADFGLAKVKQSTRSMVRSLVGTVNWQAPELWHAHPKYNHKVDVFSCAMVYWEMLQWHASTKKFPWEGMNEHAIYEIVGTKRQRPSVNGLRRLWCPAIVDLVERMWAHEHQDRPTMSQVVQELEEMIRAL